MTHGVGNIKKKYIMCLQASENSDDAWPMRPPTGKHVDCCRNVLSDTNKGNTHLQYWHVNVLRLSQEHGGTTFLIFVTQRNTKAPLSQQTQIE
jgi:hypothetical protein